MSSTRECRIYEKQCYHVPYILKHCVVCEIQVIEGQKDMKSEAQVYLSCWDLPVKW